MPGNGQFFRGRKRFSEGLLNKKPAPCGKYFRRKGRGLLEMNVNSGKKLVEIWLSRNECNDPGFRESLKPVFGKYHAEKFLVAVFMPGDGDLYASTRDLLCYNRKRLAQLEARREKP